MIVSHAIDEEIVDLREPFRVSTPASSNLTIVGERIAPLSLGVRLQRSLAPHFSAVNMRSFKPDMEIDSQTIIIEAQALNCQLQTDVKECIGSLRRILGSVQVQNVLWITTRSKYNDLCSTLSIGIAKSLRHYHPHLQLTYLDLDEIDNTTVAITARKVVELRNRESGKKVHIQQVLWSTEDEVRVVQGQELIPRIVPDDVRIDLYRSKYEPVIHNIDLQEINRLRRHQNVEMSVHRTPSVFHFNLTPSYMQPPPVSNERGPAARKRVTVRVSHSLPTAIFVKSRDAIGNLFLFVGAVMGSDATVLGFSTKQALVVTTWASWIVEWNRGAADTAKLLTQVGINITAGSLLARVPRGSKVVVNEASVLGPALRTQARTHDVDIVFLSAKSTAQFPELFIHPRMLSGAFREILPQELCLAINIGGSRQSFATIVNNMPHAFNTMDADDVLSAKSRESIGMAAEDLSTILGLATVQITELSESIRALTTTNLVDFDDVSGKELGSLTVDTKLGVFDWTTGHMAVQVMPVQNTRIFSPNATYLIVGFSPVKSVSLCQWMIENGAKFVIILSAQPCKESCINRFRRDDLTIVFYTIYNLDRQGIEYLTENAVDRGFPKLGGVIHSSIIEPNPENERSMLDFDNSLSIDTSTTLGKIFGEAPLDFYVVLCSSQVYEDEGSCLPAVVVGALIVQERRKHGLSGSILNLPTIHLGESYYRPREPLSRLGHQGISEESFLVALAETLAAARSTSPDYECTVGMTLIERSNAANYHWAKDPKFSHLIYLDEQASTEVEAKDASFRATRDTLKVQLAEATTPKEALDIATDAFAIKLQEMLHTKSKHDNRTILNQTCDSVGIDSLLAVEIQSWLDDELGVRIAVVEILNCETLGRLLRNFWDSMSKVVA